MTNKKYTGKKIGIMGLKGLPAKFGGIQFDVEEIGSRLAIKGHNVSVYCRKWYSGDVKEHKGMKLIITPTIPVRFIDVLIHTFTSITDSINRSYDIVHLFTFASYLYIPLLKLLRQKVVVTFVAEPWNDITYNRFGRMLAKLAYYFAVKFADAITAESQPLQDQVSEKYKILTALTPVGAYEVNQIEPDLIYQEYGLEKMNYILFLGRMEKVKRIEWLIKAFERNQNKNIKLVIAGDTKDEAYKKSLHQLAGLNENIIFTGFVSGKLKEELLSNARVFVLPSISEGMPTALIEAMSYGKVCLASDLPPHAWMIKDEKSGFLFDKNHISSLSLKLTEAINRPTEALNKIGSVAKIDIINRFNWDKTVETIETVYHKILSDN